MAVSEGPPSASQSLRLVERIVSGLLPPGWTLRSGGKAIGRGSDAVWTVQAPAGETAEFAVEAKRSLVGRQVEDMLRRLASAGERPLVAASYLSATLRDRLAERGVSYADATGNVRLVADRPGLFIEQRGATKDPWPTASVLQSLRGRAASRAVRALVDFPAPYGVRRLAERSGVPLGTLSRTLDLFDREGLVTRGERGEVTGLDWDRAIRRWAQDYDWERSNRLAYYLDPRGIGATMGRLGKVDWRYAVTGASAAQHFAPIVPARQLAVYVDDAGEAADRLELRPADAGSNVVLAEPFDPVVFERTSVRDDVCLVAATQLAVDLLTGRGREPSQGEELLDWMKDREGEWRA